MADERDDPVPTEDPRQAGVSEQNAEEGPHPGARPGSAEPGDSGPSPDAPGTSHDEEGDPGQATGNPNAAG
ncbi:MAG: hypothetical protein ACXVFM_15545 [Solirubrobacteraceae bacterium]